MRTELLGRIVARGQPGAHQTDMRGAFLMGVPILAAWINRHQPVVLEYLRTEHQVLKEELSQNRSALTAGSSSVTGRSKARRRRLNG